MNADERSLADGVAAWTPPWARTIQPEAGPTEQPTQPEADPVEQAAPPAEETAAGLAEAGADEHEADAADVAVGDEPDAGHGEPVGAVEAAEAEVIAAEPLPTPPPAPTAPPPGLSDADLRPALEAILLVVDEPATDLVLAQAVDQPTERVTAALEGLAAEYTEQRRGFELRRVAGGWRLYTRADFAPYVERFVLDGQQVRLTQAALETLAVVAYKQPVTRSRISAIRGVNCDGVVRTLLARGLIEECGSEPDSGAYLYRTTTLFLERLGINSPEELPPLAPFLPDDVDALAEAHDQS